MNALRNTIPPRVVASTIEIITSQYTSSHQNYERHHLSMNENVAGSNTPFTHRFILTDLVAN